MRYQPEWVEGKTVGDSRRDAQGRYTAITKELAGRRSFTVMDLGAHAGYFSLRLADEFDATVTAVDDASELTATLEKNKHPKVTGVFQRVDPKGLAALGTFDVILCLSVLHHVPWWRSMLDMLTRQAAKVFVETAHPDEDLPGAIAHSKEIIPTVELMGGRTIHYSPGYDSRFLRPLYVVEGSQE